MHYIISLYSFFLGSLHHYHIHRHSGPLASSPSSIVPRAPETSTGMRVDRWPMDWLGNILKPELYWLVVWTPLKNISQLGWLFPIYGKTKNVPNHQPEVVVMKKPSLDKLVCLPARLLAKWVMIETQAIDSNHKICIPYHKLSHRLVGSWGFLAEYDNPHSPLYRVV